MTDCAITLPVDAERMAERLTEQLLPTDSRPLSPSQLPSWQLHSKWNANDQRRSNMAPHLAYGRHRGPHRFRSRHAAVAVCLYQDANSRWTTPLTRRPTTLRHHGGQICFPGGRIEKGETPADAALREFEEELGGRPEVHHCCGNLPRQYVYASDNLVTPIVFLIQPPRKDWQPDPVEVDEVIAFPVQTVLQQQQPPIRQSAAEESCQFDMIQQTKRLHSAVHPDQIAGTLRFAAPAFRQGSVRVWGATAIILQQLAQALRPALRPGYVPTRVSSESQCNPPTTGGE
ncbi:CoA pyrophosphatase [Rhodopirellula sp. JC737]|nr:CoA pyrophosphatase [Rhodopirellula sp. JC737]